jgi:hypothetical protein
MSPTKTPSPLLGLAVATTRQPQVDSSVNSHGSLLDLNHAAMLLDAGRNHPSAASWLRFAAAFKSVADQPPLARVLNGS